MSLEKEVMLVYGSNLDIYNIKVKKFIKAIEVSNTIEDGFVFGGFIEDRLKQRLLEKAKSVGANAVIDVKTNRTRGMQSSSKGNAVIVEGQGFDEYVKGVEENPKKQINKFKSPLSIILIILLVIFAIPVIKIIFTSIF